MKNLCRGFALLLFFVLSQSAQSAETFFITDNGTELGNSVSFAPSISADGNAIVFESLASNLVQDGITGVHIYIYNISTNQFKRVSVSNTGAAGNSNSTRADISSDGNLVVFTSFASNLISNTGSVGNVFLRNIANNKTILVSKSYDGSTADNMSTRSQISGDGRFVTFESKATNLVPADTNDLRDIFIYDVLNDTIQKISSADDGSQTNGDSARPSISDDGRFVTYMSIASNIDLIDNNSRYDIFLWDRKTNKSTLVSKTFDDSLMLVHNRDPYISGNGKFIAFISDAKNLVPNTNATPRHLFLYNIETDSISLISQSSTGIQANDINFIPRMSNNGRFVSYVSKASNLVNNDTNNSADLFVYDTLLNSTERVNLTNQGDELNANIDFVNSINENGQVLAFASSASNLGGNYNTQVVLRVRDPIANISPVAHAGMDQTVLCTGINTAVQLNGTLSTDPDSDQSLSYNWTGGTFSNSVAESPLVYLAPGTHHINLLVTDNMGATNSDDVLISVKDIEPPIINTPLLVTLEASSLLGAHHLMAASTSDNCSNPTMNISINDTWFPLGNTEVSIYSVDDMANSTQTTVTIKVQDTIPPTITTPANIILEATGIKNIIDIGQATATDIFSIEITNNAPPSFPLGKTLVTWTATDSNGNSTHSNQEIIVRDTTAPTFEIIEIKNKHWPRHRKLQHVITVKNLSDLIDKTPDFDIHITMNTPAEHRTKRHHKYAKKALWKVKKVDNSWEIWLKKSKKRHYNENLIYTINISASDDFGNIKTIRLDKEVNHGQHHRKKYRKKFSKKHLHNRHYNKKKYSKKKHSKRQFPRFQTYLF